MRPRMYGSTETNSLRTRTSPAAGASYVTSALWKSADVGQPTGRFASWIWVLRAMDMELSFMRGTGVDREPVRARCR